MKGSHRVLPSGDEQGAYGAAKVLAEPKAEGCAAAAGAGKDVANDANGLGAAERV
jgi:hypothetical protein